MMKTQKFKIILIFTIFAILSAVNAAEKLYFYGSINFIKDDEIEFFLGHEDKIKPDDELSIMKGNKIIGRIKVIIVGEYVSVGKIIGKDEKVKIDTTCIITNKYEVKKEAKKEKVEKKEKEKEKEKEEKKQPQFVSIKKSPLKTLKGKINVIYQDKIVINLGKKDGVEKDMEFKVKRDDKIIGTIKVIEVKNLNSICVILDSKEAITKNDIIIYEEVKEKEKEEKK